MKEKVRELWNLCFNDDEAFTRLYFAMRYNEEVNIVLEREGKVLSALQMLPYPMTFHQNVIATAYISGACTHPDYRKMGVMKQLLTDAFAKMYERNIPLTTLIPANKPLFDYYYQMGYSSVFDYTEQIIKVDDLICSLPVTLKVIKAFDDETLHFFNLKMSQRNCCIQHSQEDIDVIFAATQLEKNGEIFAVYHANKVVGVAFAYTKEEKTYILELVSEDNEIQNTALFKIALHTGSKEISYLQLPQKDNSKSLGMARVIDAERLLQLYAKQYPQISISFELTDSIIQHNNATYYINKGSLTKDYTKGSDLKISIQQLTQALMGYNLDKLPKEFELFASCKPYISLMLN